MSLFSPREAGSPNSQKLVWFDPNDYDSSIVRDSSNGTPLVNNGATWEVTVNRELVESRGVNLTITVKNKTQVQQSAPFVRINSGMYHPNWVGAGANSFYRHVLNHMNHDSYGMRPEAVAYPAVKNPSTDKFGNPNAIYGVNWFAPCLAIENWKTGLASAACQMTSVSTNYSYPFKIYGDFDASTLKAYFRIEGNVNTDKGIVDKFQAGETRTWKVWLRYEEYNSFTSYNGSASYRRTAALRSYEPYFVWFWANHSDSNVGPRISGRIYGINLAGPNAPKAYFTARDNQRRYYLFSTQDKQSLQGRLPLPGQEYINPQTVSGWRELLDSTVDVSLLKTYGYQAVMFLNIAGWGNNDRGENPAFFTNLPQSLRNSLAEIKEWEEENQFRVIFAADNTLSKVNLGDFTEPAVDFQEDEVLHDQFETDNFFEGGLRSASGLSLLGLPENITSSYVTQYVQGWRASYPSVSMASGARNENSLYLYVAPGYVDRSEFLTKDYSKGGRDWFLDLLLSGLDPWVYMPIASWYADYGPSSTTNTAYEDYVLYIESVHQAIPVTIDYIVRRECLLPNKLSWKESFVTYSSIFALGGGSSICQVGDALLGGRKVCLPKDIHITYSSNVPDIQEMIGLYQFDAYYDWTLPGGSQHSWVPVSGITNDFISGSGDSLLWLFQQDKLDKAKATLYQNITGFGRSGGVPYIPATFTGSIFHNFELRAYNTSNNQVAVQVGNGLIMMSQYASSTLIRSSPSSGLAARTLRDWWIWAVDQSEPGWSSGKTLEQQDDYLQKKWAERWIVWINELNDVIRQLRPNVQKIGFFGAVPTRGIWSIDGLDFGSQNPDATNSLRDLEVYYWKEWMQAFDFISPAMYLWDRTANYDANLYYSQTGRKQADPIQQRIFYLMSLRNFHDIARIANKPLCPFIWNGYLRASGYINPNISDFTYRSLYMSGCQGVIWWATVYTHNDAVATTGDMQQNWYPVSRFIEQRNFTYNIDVDPPPPISFGVGGDLSGSSSFIAKYGKYGIVSLGGTEKRDQIEGFGVQRYKNVPSGGVGDQFPEDYSGFEIVAVANSIDGIIELPKALAKYNRVELDIVNPSLVNIGMPHWTIEDTFEWVNSGAPSHLSQVHHSNILSGGLAGERISPGLQDSVAPPYQAKYCIPCNSDWYDKENSTVDYEVFTDLSNRNLSLPCANAVLSVPELGYVFVGGYGGVLTINTVTKEVNRLSFKSDRTLLVKDIRKYQNTVYILDESKLYFFDVNTQKITKDTASGLPKKLHSFVSIFGSNLVIGAEDGVYARKNSSSTWTKVVSTSLPVNVMSSPDAAMAVSDSGESYYSTDGFNWNRVGVINNQVVNKLQKHRSQMLFGTTKGLFQDGGSFYSGNLSLQLLDILGDIEDSAAIGVNDIDSDFTKSLIGLSDGRYVVYADDFVVYTTSKLPTIHKVLIVNSDIWLFGNAYFKLASESFIRKLATGSTIN